MPKPQHHQSEGIQDNLSHGFLWQGQPQWRAVYGFDGAKVKHLGFTPGEGLRMMG